MGGNVFHITYIFNGYQISVKRINNSIEFDFSATFLELRNSLQEASKNQENQLHQKGDSSIHELILSFSKLSEINDSLNIIYTHQYFIPAGRSFFSNIQSNMFTFLNNNLNIDRFLIEFGTYYEKAKVHYVSNTGDEYKSLGKTAFDILKGNYLFENDHEYLIHPDGRKVNLSFASSGQQEALPLILILQSIPKEYGSSLYIEEPEAHLYPDAQKQIVQLLAQVFNSGNKQLFITTHSPYILAAFNNLIEAGNIIKEKPHLAENVYKIIPNEEVIQLKDLIAYSIKNGKKTVLIDEENNLISQNILDDISNEIAEEFGKLLDLD